ncbi:VOC family protein [Hamadaea sp. NPDC051192]|uniref:VOC family protein n=1 Tax=Hamadaea sp. NPDC051192 TaxID=3154940 RepID=UPI0034394868
MRGRTQNDGSTPRDQRHDYWGAVLDSPDAQALARFYAELLGWELGPEGRTIIPPDSVGYLAFQDSPEYVRPVWPPAEGRQQQMLHLDFEVEDLAAAVGHAVELGATPAEFQPQAEVRVMLDPDGHPFCLYANG